MTDVLENLFLKQREEFRQSADIRDKSLIFPEQIEEIKDVCYGDGGKNHRMDIFYKKDNRMEAMPVIVNVHGGGMILGSKEFNRFYCAKLSERGYLVFSVEYGLCPEATAFEQFSDLSAAMNTIKELIFTYKGNPSKVYLVADSGGACVSLYTVAMQKCRALADAAGVMPSDLTINAMGLISGMFYTTKFDKIGLFLPKYLYGRNYKKSSFAPYLNPGHRDIVTSLPPCYLVTSADDMLQNYTLSFAKELARYHMTYKLMNYPKDKKKTHAFSVFEPDREDSICEMENMLHFLQRF